MQTRRPPLHLAALLALAACSSGSPTKPAADAARAIDAATADAPTANVAMVPAEAADAICGALFRCCESDQALYFAPYRGNDLLAAFKDRLPPDATLDETSCKAVVKDMLTVVPLGDWVSAAQRGEATFDAAAFATCISALDTAACGEPMRAALWDSTCLGFAPPGGGAEQRRFFHRDHGVGSTCGPIRDGIGAALFGTCDPTASFCCYSDPAHPGCQMPYDDAGHPRTGTCQAVAATGQACSSALPLTLCATGSDCSSDTDTCVPPVTTPLAVGAACIDASYNLLGTCTASWCDIFGSKQCEPLRANGASCGGGDECASGRCDTTCVVNDVCTDHAPTPDAGVADAAVPDARTPDAMPPDAMPPDAGTPDAVPADGERCTSAFDLLASSSASPLPGYTNRIARGFGATNDYNPLSSGGLPPACSVVYDAKGKELVYAVTLVPGDKLKLRAELADGKQAGIYLLDTCPGGSWPDFDGTGACGSNEYNAGFCGPVGCDPAALTITYPLTIGGNPTTTQTFWVVVDQVGGDTSTGFVLDWSITHL